MNMVEGEILLMLCSLEILFEYEYVHVNVPLQLYPTMGYGVLNPMRYIALLN